jgi:hypothetical protein
MEEALFHAGLLQRHDALRRARSTERRLGLLSIASSPSSPLSPRKQHDLR